MRIFLAFWLFAASLAVGMVQAQTSGTATTPVTIGGAIPCDIGPSVPSAPTQAVAAGFTHCIANFDFSRSTYSVPAFDSNNTWADCYGDNQTPGIIWHGGSAGIRELSPCNIRQVMDLGRTVLDFRWLPGYVFGGGGQSNQVSLQTNNMYTAKGTYNPTLTVGNYYVETINRLKASCPASACSQNAGGPNDVYMWGFINSPDGSGLEVDIQEFHTNAHGASGSGVAAGNCAWSNGGQPCWSNWQAQSAIIGVPNYSNLDYHNYGALLTSNGATNKYICMYIDDVLQNPTGCLVAMNGNGVADHTFLNRSYVTVGASSNSGNAGQPIDFMVQNVIVWSCANYKNPNATTAMCNGTTLTSSTLGTGQTLAYYH